MNPSTMLYPELFKAFESVRWDLARDVPWDSFDGDNSPRNRRSPSR